MKTLKEYYEMPELSNNERATLKRKIITMYLENPVKYELDIEEILEYFIDELASSDLRRLFDQAMERR